MDAFILLIILIAVNAAFAAAEIAVISMNDTKMKKMADSGDKRAQRLIALTDQPAKFLSTIQVAITLASLMQSAFAAENFAGPLVKWLVNMGVNVPEEALKTVSIMVITVVLAYFTLVFGELVPKRVAMKKTEGIALGMSGVLYWVAKICAPIVWFLTLSTNLCLKILRINPKEEDSAVTEEEIRMMLAEGKEKGTIPSEENELIQNVFEFNDITADELCTHRRDVIALSTEDEIEEWQEIIKESRHNLYPVCGESLDDIVGVLDTKDYFRSKELSKEYILEHVVEKAMLIPESMKANTLFKKMQTSRDYFAVVIDEYGGMSGIITLHDIIESLFGDISEKEDPDKALDIQKISDTSWLIHGSADLEDVAEILKIALPIDDYDTFNGFVCDILDRIPEEGENVSFEWKNLKITIHDVKNHIVQFTTVELKTPAE
ncbi:MAG: HlyC/CorC family transporter [Firmicutes bacterium]|nr:HlyC/CorC family transporter [Bacillota bacterium]